MEQSPEYKYRIVKGEYLDGRIYYSAQKAEHNYLLQIFHDYYSLVRPHKRDTYETTRAYAEEILEWHIYEDLQSYKRYKKKYEITFNQ
jgi:hypothetical protein